MNNVNYEISPGLFLPDYEENSIMNLSNFVLDHFGCETSHNPFPMDIYVPNLEKKKKIVLLIIDALGAKNLDNIISEKKEIADIVSRFRREKITSIFPTTTTAALTTICTGCSPIEHGMLGYILFLKKFLSYVNMIDLAPLGLPRDILTHHGLNPGRFLPVKTIYQRLIKKGVKTITVTSNLFKNSGLSLINHQGSSFRGYTDALDMVQKMKYSAESEPSPLFILAYWGLSDTKGHQYGPNSHEYKSEVEWLLKIIDKEFIGKVDDKLKEEMLFIITADHGQIETDWTNEEWISPKDKLVRDYLLIPPAGEPRALYLWPKNEKEFVEYFSNRFKERFFLLKRSEAIQLGLFGPAKDLQPIKEEISDRIGEYISIARSAYSLNYKYSPSEKTLKGKHGSLTDWELFVPLLLFY